MTPPPDQTRRKQIAAIATAMAANIFLETRYSKKDFISASFQVQGMITAGSDELGVVEAGDEDRKTRRASFPRTAVAECAYVRN